MYKKGGSRCVQQQIFDVNDTMESNCVSDNVNHAVQVVAEVISGQGQTRLTKHTHKSAGKSNTPSNDKQYFQKYRSLSGQCYDPARRVVGRKFYNKNTTPTQIESLLVRPLTHSINIFKANAQKQVARSYACVVKNRTKNQSSSYKYCKGGVFWAKKGVNIPISKTEARTPVGSKEFNTNASSSKQPSRCDHHDTKERGAPHTNVNTLHNGQGAKVRGRESNDRKNEVEYKKIETETDPITDQVLLFDIRNAEGDKFVNSIIFGDNKKIVTPVECRSYDQWRLQSDMNFGFIPLTDPILPTTDKVAGARFSDPTQLHKEVRRYNLPNYLGARIPVNSQMNIRAWKDLLGDYWDQQLIQCLEFGFPLGFNRLCSLKHDKVNHKSAVEFPQDVEKYIQEERSFGAIIGPFEKAPIENLHYSPFMTRHKPNSDTRRVILDLSWPRGDSVNAGVEKDGYLGADFKLTFPSIDDLTKELVKIGKGAHIFKVDVSRAFRHLNVDPGDFDLLGLSWNGTYIDTRIPFGSRHGSQFMQRTSDAVRHIMRQRDVSVINYIDDFLGYGTPDVARRSYDALIDVMAKLGITISKKKLVAPTTQAVCLGILIDTVQGTVAIPPDKLQDIKIMIKQWKGKKVCTKRELQSLLGTLLYIHKCVKPARCFLNRMLETLRSASNPAKISLSNDFHRDLGWFDQFLPKYNGISMYAHQVSNLVLELDACLTGLGGRYGHFVYHLPLPRGFRNLDIVHLEMVNILLAVRLFAKFWAGKRVLVKCDNDAVVKVLSAGKARDPYLGACARNIWYMAALSDIDLQYVHVLGKNNVVADLLSRWQYSLANVVQLETLVKNPVWLPVSVEMLEIDNKL